MNQGSWLYQLGSLGDRPGDSDDERLRHRLLVYMGLLMSCGGLVWGGLSLYGGMVFASIVPYGYTAATALNLVYFGVSKNFRVVRIVQVLLSLLLPFLFRS